jgi:hypothetical protein
MIIDRLVQKKTSNARVSKFIAAGMRCHVYLNYMKRGIHFDCKEGLRRGLTYIFLWNLP